MEHRGPFFSIIIPTCNSSATLNECLKSIADQSFDDYEVHLIDKLSLDSTKEIAVAYKTRIPQLNFISEQDNGIYDAMNKGVERSTGEYIYFLGSDDTLFDEKVLFTVAAELKKDSAKILYGNVIMLGSNKWVNHNTKHAGEFDLKRLMSHNICHQSIFYHHSVFDSLGNFNLKYRVFADYDFNLKCFANYYFRYIDAVVANFNVGGTSSLVLDDSFQSDKIKNIISYFQKKLFSRAFVNARLIPKQAALSKGAGLNFPSRLYCLLAYIKLKIHSLFI